MQPCTYTLLIQLHIRTEIRFVTRHLDSDFKRRYELIPVSYWLNAWEQRSGSWAVGRVGELLGGGGSWLWRTLHARRGGAWTPMWIWPNWDDSGCREVGRDRELVCRENVGCGDQFVLVGAKLALCGRIGRGRSMVSGGLNSSTELLSGMGENGRAEGLQLVQDFHAS